MLIRPYQASDEPQVIALWVACGLTRPWNDPQKDIARKLQVQREWFLVGVHEDRVIATVMAGYEGHRGWVNYLAVAPAHRHAGHASALMHHTEALLLEAGCPKLNLQVRSSNTEALAFYRRIGYLQDEAVSYGKRLIAETPTESPKAMRFEVRIATASDADDVCQVVRRSIAECCGADHQGDPRLLAAWLDNKTSENLARWMQAPGAVPLVAELDGVVRGFALSVRDELSLCYVLPEVLHQGAGKALLRAIEARAQAQGMVQLRLNSTQSAKDFYVRNGFTMAGPESVWAGMAAQPMAKRLVAAAS